MQPEVCVEVLLTTILTWVGLWGLVDETLQLLESRLVRFLIYGTLLGGALLLASVQRGLTVCALL